MGRRQTLRIYNETNGTSDTENILCETNGTSDTENILCVTNRMPRMPLTLNREIGN
jgi:hypothetical protein